MTDPAPPSGKRQRARGHIAGAPLARPDWAEGLKSIYAAVVEEPLPDDMLRLLASLDGDDDKGEPG